MEDHSVLLNQNWHWGPSGLILKKWTIDFNAYKEPQNIQKVWVILPGLPVVFWQQKILEAIGNIIGNFVDLEEDWESKLDRRCTKILVELDLRNGLFEELKIVMHGSSWWQLLDYWKLHFRCLNCREVGHMQKEFPKVAMKPMFKNTWVRNQANKGKKTISRTMLKKDKNLTTFLQIKKEFK